MMPIIESSDLEKLKEYIEQAASGAEVLEKYVEAAEEVAQAGKTLSSLQKFALSLDGVSQGAMALQVISIGLSLLLAITGEESSEEKILDAVDEVIDRMKDLQKTVDLRFKQLDLANEIRDQISAANDAIARIEAAALIVDAIRDNRQKKEATSDQVAELLEFSPADIRTAFQKLHNVIQGNGPTTSLLHTMYQRNYGAAGQIAVYGDYYLHMAQTALIVLSTIEIEKARQQNKGQSEAQISTKLAAKLDSLANEYQPLLSGMAKTISDMIAKSVDVKSTRKFMQRFFEDFEPNMLLKDGNFQQAADAILHEFSTNWPYLDFAAITHEPLNDKRLACVAAPAENVLSGTSDMMYTIIWWPRYRNRPPVVRGRSHIIPMLPPSERETETEHARSMDDTYGGAPDFVAAAPDLAKQRTDMAMTFCESVNLISQKTDINLGRGFALIDQDQAAEELKKVKTKMGDQAPGWLIWTGSIEEDAKHNLGISTTSDACYLHDEEGVRLRKNNPDYIKNKKYWEDHPGGFDPGSTIIRTGFFRVGLFWADAVPEAD